jgi:hypothetical protein
LQSAAAGADPVDVAVALQMVLSLDGVECQAGRRKFIQTNSLRKAGW